MQNTLTVFLSVLLLALLAGCGGVPIEARIAVEETARGVDQADRTLASRIRTRSAELRAELLAMVAEGRVGSHEAGLAWFDRQLDGESQALRVLEVAHDALLAIEHALNAWDAGANEHGFLTAASCGIAALANIVSVFDRIGIEVPPSVVEGAEMLGGLASGGCPTVEAL